MPQIRDKIIVNSGNLGSFWAIIKGWFKGINRTMAGSDFLAQEIEDNGWLQEADALEFLKEQEADCTAVDNACAQFVRALDEFHAKQMDRNDRMRLWIDKMLSQKPPTP